MRGQGAGVAVRAGAGAAVGVETGTGSGTVTSSDGGINCGAACSAAYVSGTVVTLTAAPALTSNFTGWSGCDTVSGTTCTVTMSAARSVSASFLGAPPLF